VDGLTSTGTIDATATNSAASGRGTRNLWTATLGSHRLLDHDVDRINRPILIEDPGVNQGEGYALGQSEPGLSFGEKPDHLIASVREFIRHLQPSAILPLDPEPAEPILRAKQHP
jgi:hypothetical protein